MTCVLTIGGSNPFLNQSGILHFSKDAVERVKLTLIVNDTLQVHCLSTGLL